MPRAAALLALEAARSVTFRRIVEAIEQTDVIVVSEVLYVLEKLRRPACNPARGGSRIGL
jgi:hypothetical protein